MNRFCLRAPASLFPAVALRRGLSAAARMERTTCGMIPVTTDLELIDPLKAPKFSMYQVLDSNGNFVPGAKVAPLSKETALKMYRTMVRIQAIDDVFYNAQVRL